MVVYLMRGSILCLSFVEQRNLDSPKKPDIEVLPRPVNWCAEGRQARRTQPVLGPDRIDSSRKSRRPSHRRSYEHVWAPKSS